MKRREVIKSSIFIHTCHNLTTLQHQLWNFLLAHAYDNLLSKCEHQIPMQDIQHYVRSRNLAHIKNSLIQLTAAATHVVHQKTGGPTLHGLFTLLENVRFVDAYCYYSYPTDVAKLLRYHKNSYAKIDLELQLRFVSKYALILYELCLDYVDVGQTPSFPIETFRLYLGLGPNYCINFGELNFRIIKKALVEINTKTSLMVQMKPFGNKDAVTEVKFYVQKRTISQSWKPVEATIPAALESVTLAPKTNREKTVQEPANPNQELIKQLMARGIVEQKARELLAEFGIPAVKSALEYLAKHTGEIHNITAWFTKVLENARLKNNGTKTISPAKPQVQQIALESAWYTEERKKLFVLNLQKEHNLEINRKRKERFESLTSQEKENILENFNQWLQTKPSSLQELGLLDIYKLEFLNEMLVSAEEKNFELWAKSRGYVVEKKDKQYRLIGKQKQELEIY